MFKKRGFPKKIVAVMLAATLFAGTSVTTYADTTYDSGESQNYSVQSGLKSGASTAETDNYVSKINTFNATFVSGATKTGSDYVWSPKTSAAGHAFKYRVDYSYSVVGSIPAETIQIRVPASILSDKNGNSADTVIMSYPTKNELADMTDAELAETDGFAYYVDGDDIVVYNFRAMDGAIAGSFEIAYQTSKTTQNYYDYGSTNAGSKAFTAATTASNQSASANAPKVYINTTATIKTTYKKSPRKVYRTWNSSWGDDIKPSNDSDYYYLYWEIQTYINTDVTQTYDFTLNDVPSSSQGSVRVIGYYFSGTGKYTTNNTITNATGSGYRYDGVITAMKKSDFQSLNSWTVNNKITATVTPVDKVDAATSASSTAKFQWTKPVYVHPTGHFYVWKFGNENWEGLFGSEMDEWPYASYSLDELQEQTVSSLDDIKYAIWGYGYPFPWTVKDGTTGSWSTYVDDLNASKVSDPYAFGYKDVTYTITDDTFYPLDGAGYGTSKSTGTKQSSSAFSSTTYTDSSDLTPLASDDYDISYLSFTVSYTDVPRNSDGHIASAEDVANGKASQVGFDEDEQTYTTIYKSYDSTDVLTIYTKSGDNDYVVAGTLDLSTLQLTKTDGSLIDSVARDNSSWGYYGRYRLTFKDGVDGVKIQDTNNYYYSDYKIYTYISIKGSDPVLGWVRTGTYGSANKDTKAGTEDDPYEDQMVLKNVVNMTVDDYSASYDSTGTLTNDSANIIDLSKVVGDRLRTTQRNSQITKEVTGGLNVARKKSYTISWKVNAFESYLSGTDNSQYLQQSSGTFYDLLPAGSSLQANSVKIGIPKSNKVTPRTNSSGVVEGVSSSDALEYLSSSDYEVTTIENYKDSGRTMLIVKVNRPALYYTMFYNTTYPWDSITDFGTDVLNPVAYETGNDKIYNGYPDNGGVGTDADGNTTHALSTDSAKSNNELYMTDLDSETDDAKFIYAERTYDVVATIAASSGLNKRIMAEDDTGWVYDTVTTSDGNYQYRLRLANSFLNDSKNLIFYDSLENSDLVDGADAPESDWYGTLQSIDLSQLKMIENGANEGVYLAPVAYVSTKSRLDLDNVTDNISGTNLDISNGTIWTEYSKYYSEHNGDLSDVKAIAIDMRKDTSGQDFVLKKGGSLSAILYMKAPHTAASKSGAAYPWAYNSVYLHETLIDALGNQTTSTINQNYTSIRLIITGDVSLKKVSEKDTNKTISNITFRLYGTSDYGTAVDEQMTTGRQGTLTFSDIEKGTYILQEYKTNSDWLLDHTEHTVVIDDDGKTTIDGVDYTDKKITITNEPRIHTDVSFEKISMPDIEVTQLTIGDLAQSKFKLSGTSDYGNEILMYATATEKTNSKGEGLGTYYVSFDDLEKGSYDLVETSCADTYVKNPCTYKVTVDADGNCTIVNTTPKPVTLTTEKSKTETQDITLHAHTANIDDTGTATKTSYNNSVNYNSTYTATVDGNVVSENCQTVTIPGADKLTITVDYQSESTSYDWLYIYKGSIAASSSADSGTGGTLVNSSKLGGSTKTTGKTFEVEGDTVTFVWRTDSSGNSYYGYYATITGTSKSTTYYTETTDVPDLYAVKLSID